MPEAKEPAKLTIEITADGVIQTLIANDGSQLWQVREEMETAGYMTQVDGKSIEDAGFDDWWADEIIEAIDDLSFGPFHVASAMYNIKYGD